MADVPYSGNHKELIQELTEYFGSLDKTMNPEDRAYIQRRGFQIHEGPAPPGLEKPHFVMSNRRLELVSGYDGKGACAVSAEFFDVQEDTHLLANMAATLILAEKKDFGKYFGGEPFYYDCPEGEPFLVYVESDEWLPVAEKLLEMYG